MKPAVIVTGATGYFGKYFVKALQSDYQVIATSRNINKLSEHFSDPSVSFLEVDLYRPEELKDKLSEVVKKFRVVGLINNAYDFSTKTGFNTTDGRIENISIEQIRAGLESGLLSQILCCQVVGSEMVRQKISGSIINISSMYGQVAPDARLYLGRTVLNPVTYSICKAGMDALTRYLSSFWGQYGIRCNSIAPGAYPNTESDSPNAPKDEEFISRLSAKTTLNRVGHPTDLLGLTKFLISDESKYITGQIIAVDGGWTAI